jgi:predicted AAA+ superfamily ATPase
LERLYGFLVSNAAHLVSPSKLTGISGVKSPSTVLDYFSWFEAAYLIQLVPCFSWSVKAQSLAPKKLYISDPGIIQTGSRSFSPDLGALLEIFVFNHLKSDRLRNSVGLKQPGGKDIFYFADKSGECDFILNPGAKEGTLCIQVCYELTPDNQDRELAGLNAALDFFPGSRGLIITRNTRDLIVKDGKRITVLPAWKWASA